MGRFCFWEMLNAETGKVNGVDRRISRSKSGRLQFKNSQADFAEISCCSDAKTNDLLLGT